MSSNGWKEVKLGDYINIKHGYAFKGEFFSEIETEDVLVTPGNFKIGGGFKEDKLKYYNGEYPHEYVLKPNDVIVTMTDLSKTGDTLGYSALVPYNNMRRYLHNQRIGLVEFISKEIFPLFLYWRLRNKDYQNYIVNSASGTTVKHTSPKTIKSFTLNLPPLSEQKAIAATLSCLDDKIELNNRINKTLEEMAQAIFKSWFVDFEPFQDGEFEDSELGRIPKGWRVGTLGQIADITSGKRPPLKQEILSEEMCVPVVGARCIMAYTDEALIDEKILITGRVGTHGVIQRFNTPCWPSDNTLVIKSRRYEFVYQILNSVDYKSMNRGSTQPLITQTDLKNVIIIIPPDEVSDDFENITADIMNNWYENNNQNKNLILMRDTLLPKLMSGEIRVPLEGGAIDAK